MVQKTVISFITALCITAGAQAAEIDGHAVLGSMVGAGVGSAVGSATGGKEGAIIGGGIGGAIGAAVGSKRESTAIAANTVVSERVVTTRNVIVDDERHDRGKHKGHHKNRNKHQHGHDRD